MSVSIAPSVAKARSLVGVECRKGDPAAIAEARRALAEANIAAYIERTVATAPPLSEAQKDRLARLLRAGAA